MMGDMMSRRQAGTIRVGVTLLAIAVSNGCASLRRASPPPPPPSEPLATATLYEEPTGFVDELEAALASWDEERAADEELLPAYLPEGAEGTAPTTAPPIAPADRHETFGELLQREHPMVERWIRYFTSEQGRQLYVRFYRRYLRYGPEVRRRLRAAGLPEELAWVAFIESGFNPWARSRARAVGLWQFIRHTARRYGLRIDTWIDERRDPWRATEAAAAHLKDLYARFDSWELALAAYNAGAGRVARAIRRAGHRDYWRFVPYRHLLPRETRHYVPKLIAAHRISTAPERYGLALSTITAEPVTWQTLDLPGGIALAAVAETAGLPLQRLREYNPHLRRRVLPPGRRTRLYFPPEATAAVLTALAKGRLREGRWAGIHIVRRGETLWTIARAYGLSVRELKALNGLRGRLIRPGQRLVVIRGDKRTRRSAYVRVRRGDTLSAIARRYGVRVRDLKRWNGLRGDRIHVGQRLRIVPRDRSTPPGTIRYRVRPGDSLWSIARRHGVSVRRLKRLNGLRGTRIRIGQILYVPIDLTRRATSDRPG